MTTSWLKNTFVLQYINSYFLYFKYFLYYVFIWKQYRKKETNQFIKLCGFAFSLVENKLRILSKGIWLFKSNLFYVEKIFKINVKLVWNFEKILRYYLISERPLIHFSPMLHFFTPCRHFLTCPGKWNIRLKWVKMDFTTEIFFGYSDIPINCSFLEYLWITRNFSFKSNHRMWL